MNRYVADLHIHSYYSRATSKNLNLENLAKWAQIKGVQLVATGDIAHPSWLSELREKLVPAEDGLFQLNQKLFQAVQEEVPAACHAPVRFLLGGEISNIYKRHDQVRKVHNLCFFPTFAALDRFQATLEKIGNIRSDGRPILGLDSRDLLEITLETDDRGYFIPAHIWTPWFAMFGSKSGFDSVEECFGDLTGHIFAVETGLSADPAMCWRVSDLDKYTLVSNSDAHSPPKLAREASIFQTEWSYDALFDALHSGDPKQYLGTIEFFPEEGKYHFDGHRKCGVCWHPQTSIAHNDCCTVCGKPVTVGVMHRVETLADRPEGGKPALTHPYQSIIPLPEILAEVEGVGAGSKRVQGRYFDLLGQLGNELHILLDAPLTELEQTGGTLFAEGIRRVRQGTVQIAGGYDGEFGVIKLFEEEEKLQLTAPQLQLLEPIAEPDVIVKESSSKESTAKESTAKSSTAKSSTTKSSTAKTGTQIEQCTPSMHQASMAESVAGGREGEARETHDGKRDSGQDDAEAEETEPEEPSRHQIRHDAPTAYLPADEPISTRVSLSSLNAAQRVAVECIDDPLIIVAGPGTGKTRTLTVRIAHLIETHDVAPESILAITFTNKAAEEMRGRLVALVGEPLTQRVTIQTFHAFGAQLLRSYAEAQGNSPFAIAGAADQAALIKEILPDATEKVRNDYLAQIAAAKDRLFAPDDPALPEALPTMPDLPAVYGRYAAYLRANRLLDFDDLIYQTVQLLESQPMLLQHYQTRYRWLSVDEYQDINYAQYRLLRLLTPPATNLCAIGDPDQAIYGFRGAKRAYFLRFQEDFPDAQILQLSQNYRSTQTILDAAGQVIEESEERATALQIWSDFVDQTKLTIYQATTDKAEAEYVVHQVEQMVGGTSYFSLDSGRTSGTEEKLYAFGDFAVLYRTSAQSRVLIEAFDRSGIPYQTVGQTPLTDYKEIRQILAYLWLMVNPTSTFYQEQVYANARRKDLLRIGYFLPRLQEEWVQRSVAELIDEIAEFLRIDLENKPTVAQQERIDRLRRRALPFAHDLHAFLETTLLQHEADHYDPRADRVTLMTLHAAKGLEFPVLFIVGCEEALLPYELAGRTADLEEERRLFYVGMTRAEQRLILLHARRRTLYGQRMQNEPSRFLADIAAALKELRFMGGRKSPKVAASELQLSLF